MNMRKGIYSLLLTLVLFVAASPLRAEVSATASLNVQRFAIDQMAQLTVTVQGQRSIKVNPPEVDGLHFYQRGQSTRMEIINGSYSASVSTMFHVQASREGKFTIPPIVIQTKEGTVETDPIVLEVTAVTAAPSRMSQAAPQSGGNTTRLRNSEAAEVAFLRVVPAKTTSYSGELVPVEIKVYFREGIQANLNSLPQLQGEGFVLQQFQREPYRSREIIGNSRYSVLSWNSTLSGVKEGEHALSMELDATLLLREQHRRQHPRGMFGDPFFDDSFFNSFFGSYREKEVKIGSQKITMMVKPLPQAGKPETFTGAIGDFRLHVEATPLVIAKGDPVTVTMTISGEGNFDRVQAPKVQNPKGWKTYSPSSEFLEDENSSGGRKVFEQALVAKDANLKAVPAVAFSYFDPRSETYKELISAPIPLTMEQKEPAAVNTQVSQQAQPAAETKEMRNKVETVPPPIEGLAPLQLSSGELGDQFTPLLGKRWFQIVLLVVFSLILVVWIVQIRKTRLAKNPRQQQRNQMRQLLDKRLADVEKYRATGDGRGFLASCRAGIQEQLGLLWGKEAGAITFADLEANLPEESSLKTIFAAAEESAYSGHVLSAAQMEEFATSLKQELSSL